MDSSIVVVFCRLLCSAWLKWILAHALQALPLCDLASIADFVYADSNARFSTIASMWSIFLKFRVLNLDVHRWFGLICLRFCQSPKMLHPVFVKGILRSALLQRTCVSCLDRIWSLCCCRSALLCSFLKFHFWNQLSIESQVFFHVLWETHYDQHSCRQWWTAHGTRCGQVVCSLTAP